MPLPPREYDRSVNPEIERLLYQAQVVRQDAEGVLSGLTDSQFNWTPPDGRWSMAQCLDHLNVTNGRFLPALRAAVEKGIAEKRLNDGPYAYGFVSRYLHRMMGPPPKKRFKAPKRFQPAPRRSLPEALAEWDRTHAEMERLIRSSNGLDLVRLKVPSPVTKLIQYNLGMAFWIMMAHDRRHICQAREVRNLPAFPAE